MNTTDVFSKPGKSSRRLAPEMPTDCYRGVELAPNTLESLVTWDVSGRAQRERERLDAIQRMPTEVQGGC